MLYNLTSSAIHWHLFLQAKVHIRNQQREVTTLTPRSQHIAAVGYLYQQT